MWESLDPLEGCRIELIDGRFVATPVQGVKHQRAGDQFVYIPDVVLTTERIETVSVDVANVALVVEIVSPSTKKSDRLMKPAALAAAGVPAYWRVELDGADGPVVYCHRLNDGVYSDVVTLTPGNQQPVLVAGTISVTFDPADLHKPRLWSFSKAPTFRAF